MKIKIPQGLNFDGAKFGKHYFADFDPNIPDPRFWVDADGYLICPSIETDMLDLSIFEAQPIVETEKYFDLPIRTPALYADDVFVSSRDINPDADAAFIEAITETEKGKGEPKSLDLIVRSTFKALKHAMKEIDKLRLDVEQLKKKVK